MSTGDTKGLNGPELQSYLLQAVAPGPIALVSTLDQDGRADLSPFCFFNVLGTEPPELVFSPARGMADTLVRHTLENLQDQRECVVNIVDYDLLRQVALTEQASLRVRPPRVAESPVQLECRVKEIVSLGQNPGAGSLVIAEVLLIHFRADLLDAKGLPLKKRLDHVARLGGDWYLRVKTGLIFQLPKPMIKK